MTQDEKFMKHAMTRAKAAAALGEVPIGAVIVKDGKIVSSGKNMREIKANALLHAEIKAIDRACKRLGAWRLCDCTLDVTLEPCPMCAGAAMNARVERIVYGAFDDKNGACASVATLFDEKFTHIPMVRSRVLKERCGEILSEFFKDKR